MAAPRAHHAPASVKEILQDYSAKLSDLTFPSKPIINMLTMVAEDNVGLAPEIADIIVGRIDSVPVDKRLPVIYLMDSILKNVGRRGEINPFLPLFAKHADRLVVSTFASAKPDTRRALDKLVRTWEETGLFREDVLIAIRRGMDEALDSRRGPPPPPPYGRPPYRDPYYAPPPPHSRYDGGEGRDRGRDSYYAGRKRSADREPDYYPRKRPHYEDDRRSAYGVPPASSSHYPPPRGGRENGYSGYEDYYRGSPTKDRRGHSPRRRSRTPPYAGYPPPRDGGYPPGPSGYDGYPAPAGAPAVPVTVAVPAAPLPVDPKAAAVLQQLEAVLSSRPDALQLQPYVEEIKALMASGRSPQAALQKLAAALQAPPAIVSAPAYAAPATSAYGYPGPGPNATVLMPAAAAAPSPSAVLPMPLGAGADFSWLANLTAATAPSDLAATAAVPQRIVEPSFEPEYLKSRDPSSIYDLFEGLGRDVVQCKTCGLRLPDQKAMEAHMDWHFSQNKPDSSKVRVGQSRSWFLPDKEWLVYESGKALATQAAFPTFATSGPSASSGSGQGQGEVGGDGALAGPGAEDRLPTEAGSGSCDICHEPFEQAWDDDHESYVYLSALRLPVEEEMKELLEAGAPKPEDTAEAATERLQLAARRAAAAMHTDAPWLKAYQGRVMHTQCFHGLVRAPPSHPPPSLPAQALASTPAADALVAQADEDAPPPLEKA